MVKKESIKKNFSFLFERKDVLAILLYGSHIKGEDSKRSDIDACVVAPKCKNRLDLLRYIHRSLDVRGGKYDVRIFEDMPMHIRIQVIRNNEIIFARDVYDLYEYFYFVQRLWEDQAHRQKLTKDELAEML